MNELLKVRKATGLTRAEVASLADVSPAYLQSLEGGYVPRRSKAVERIWKVLAAAPPASRERHGGQRWTKRPKIKRDIKAALSALEDERSDLAQQILRKTLRDDLA